jgi:hypothetical protein
MPDGFVARNAKLLSTPVVILLILALDDYARHTKRVVPFIL